MVRNLMSRAILAAACGMALATAMTGSAAAQQPGEVVHDGRPSAALGIRSEGREPWEEQARLVRSRFRMSRPTEKSPSFVSHAVSFDGQEPVRFAAASVQAQEGMVEPQRRTKTRAALGAIVGGVGGFFAGGYTGAFIEGDRCECDDPGLMGAIIGAPIGAAVGAILGGLYLF